MDQLLRLPFDDVEEAVLERYLLESTEPNSRELLVMHYLQRTRFVDAVRLNEKLKQQAMMGDKDPLARERTSARNIITESYVNVLPRVQRRLAFDPETRHKKPVGIRREVARPKPLSAVVNPAKSSKVISHALLLNAVLDRIAEARDVIRADETPTKNLDDTFDNSPCMEPFVGTPMTPRNRTIRSADVSVVYPEMLEGDESAPYQALSTSLNLSVTQTLRGLSNVDTPKALKEPFKRPPLDYSGAEALSLLQTPPVKRRVPVVKQEPQIAPPTPQSILKVRKVIRRSPSPPKMVTERALGPTALDVAMPSPPKFQRKTLSFAEDDSVKPKEATPGRHIRFSDDTISPQSTPSPDINELLPEPPDFSLRRETAASASPTLDPQEWGTPPISPQASPTKGATDTPPFQSPQEALTFHSPLRVDPTPQQAPEESPVAMETETETEQEEVKEYLILTPKSKAPILRGSRVLTPKQKPPTPLQRSQLQFQQQEDMAVFEPFVEDDSQTPPIPEDMVQINLDSIRRSTSPRDRDQEEGVDDEEITFNFTLRHGQEEDEEEEEGVPPAGVQAGAEEDEEGDFMLPASAAEDVEMEEQMQTEDGEGSKSTSPDVPPSFLFEELQRKPIHPLSPFQFSHPSPSTSAALPPQGGLTTTLPSPPRVSRDIAIEQAFLDGSTSPTTGSNWTLKFDQEDDEEDEEEDGMEEEEVIIDPEPKVRFGQEQVFDIPSAGPKHALESVEIQTSPMSGLTSDLPPQLATRRAEMAEMSVQTTPGLALRQREVQKTPSRVPFEESLGQTEQERSREGGASAGETAVEVAKEVVVKEAKAASPPRLAVIKQPTDEKKQAPPSPRTPKSKVKTPPRSSPRIRARLQQQKQEEEMATQAQHLTPTQQRTPAHHRTPAQDLTRDQDSTRDQSSHPDQPSFIFSPPLTRSRGRRSARKRVTAETAPPRHPSLNQTAETMLTFPSPSPQPSRGGVSLLEPAGGSVGRSGRRGRQPLAASAAANSSSVMTQIKDKPAVITPTRKTRPLHRPSPMSPEDSVVLLSPAVPDTEADSELRAQRRNPRRAVRVNPHSMTLRTPKERKKTTKVKAW